MSTETMIERDFGFIRCKGWAGIKGSAGIRCKEYGWIMAGSRAWAGLTRPVHGDHSVWIPIDSDREDGWIGYIPVI